MRKFVWLIVAIVVLVSGIIVYNKVISPKESAAPSGQAGPPKAIAVNGYVVNPKSLSNSILASGTLLAYEQIDLHPEVAGKITMLNLNEGSSVSKGTLLVKLYDADLQATLKKLQIQKANAQTTEQRLS